MLGVVLAGVSALGAHAPVLVHDPRERHPFRAVDGRGATVYARVKGDWVQYWLWSPQNTQDRGLVRTGRHAGDWEMVQLRVRGGRVTEAVATQHAIAERCPATRLHFRGDRPVVYVAHGSHAVYFRPGTRDRPFPDPNDEIRRGGRAVTPGVVEIDPHAQPWRSPGPWGDARASWVPGEQDSPRGPLFQGVRWEDPDAFARSATTCRASRCDEQGECDGREDAQIAAVAGLGLLAALGTRRRRRRRAR